MESGDWFMDSDQNYEMEWHEVYYIPYIVYSSKM
jgi:hypothetical protein